MASRFLHKLEALHPFSESEAWWLFRAAALGEAFGWTTLIIGIAINRYNLPGHAIAVPIAGQIHGTIFLVYFGVVIATYSSLRWSRGKFLVAVVAGIPPYGTLLFELWAARSRRNRRRKIHFRTILYYLTVM